MTPTPNLSDSMHRAQNVWRKNAMLGLRAEHSLLGGADKDGLRVSAMVSTSFLRSGVTNSADKLRDLSEEGWSARRKLDLFRDPVDHSVRHLRLTTLRMQLVAMQLAYASTPALHACAHYGALSPQVSNTIPTSSSTRKQIQVAMDAAGGKPAGAGGIDIDRVLALLENTEAGAAAAPPAALTTALARRSLPEGAEMGADGSQAVAAFGQEQEQQQEQEEEQEKEQQQQQQKEQEQEVRPSPDCA